MNGKQLGGAKEDRPGEGQTGESSGEAIKHLCSAK